MLEQQQSAKSLAEVLAAARPYCHRESYVFVSVPAPQACDFWHSALVVVRENDICSLVLPVERAQEWGFPIDNLFSCLDLNVKTSLSLVGLTAHVAVRLAEVGIACNVVAAFDKDLFFVPSDRSEEALAILSKGA